MPESNTLPSSEQAHDVVTDIHKRAFFGRLEQHGIVPATEKEAYALLDLGVQLLESQTADGAVKSASDDFDYGDGPYASLLQTFSEQNSGSFAPGFGPEKQASRFGSPSVRDIPELPQSLSDAAWNTAVQLAQNPMIYGSALVKRAELEAAFAEMVEESGGGRETESE